MDRKIARLKKRLAKKAKRGIRGYPVGTLTCYGPDDRRASKLVAAVVEHEGGEATEMRKWYSEHGDVRDTVEIIESRPLSARKRWRVCRVVRTATGAGAQPSAAAE